MKTGIYYPNPVKKILAALQFSVCYGTIFSQDDRTYDPSATVIFCLEEGGVFMCARLQKIKNIPPSPRWALVAVLAIIALFLAS